MQSFALCLKDNTHEKAKIKICVIFKLNFIFRITTNVLAFHSTLTPFHHPV